MSSLKDDMLFLVDMVDSTDEMMTIESLASPAVRSYTTRFSPLASFSGIIFLMPSAFTSISIPPPASFLSLYPSLESGGGRKSTSTGVSNLTLPFLLDACADRIAIAYEFV